MSSRAPTSAELMEGNLRYLREKYAIGFITFEELKVGLDSVLRGGPVNVPKGSPERSWDWDKQKWVETDQEDRKAG